MILEEWKRYLDQTEKETFDSELGNYNWYAVLKNDKVVVIFQIIDVLKKYSKNLKIGFHPNFEQDNRDVVDIIIFIYDSMLSICNEKNIKKIKLYIDNRVIQDIFKLIVEHEFKNDKIKNAKNYGKWIEIYI